MGGLAIGTWKVLAQLYVCVTVYASNWSRAAGSGAHMSRCQQLGSLGSRGQPLGTLRVRAQLLEGASHLLYVNIYILTSRRPSCPARGEQDAGAMFVRVLCVSVTCVASSVFVCVYVCAFVCVPAGNVSSASLLDGPGDMEQQQPHLPRAVGSSMNNRFLLTAPTVPL